MYKQTVFDPYCCSSLRQSISSLIDAAEDSEKMLDQMVRDYANNIRGQAAVAQTIGNLRLLGCHAEGRQGRSGMGHQAAGGFWHKADEFRAAGDVPMLTSSTTSLRSL